MVGPIEISQRLKAVGILAEGRAAILPQAVEVVHVAVVAGGQQEIVGVAQRQRPACRREAVVAGRDGHHAANAKAQLLGARDRADAADRADIHLRRVGHRLAAARVADQRHAVEIDAAVERVAGRGVPLPPHRQVLQQQPGPQRNLGHVRVIEGVAVEEVLVHRDGDHPPAGQVFTEISVAGIGGLGHGVVAVDDEYQRERPVAFGIPDQAVQGQAGEVEAVVPLEVALGQPRIAGVDSRAVNGRRHQRGLGAILRPVAVVAAAIAERLDGQRPRQAGVVDGQRRHRGIDRCGTSQIAIEAGQQQPNQRGQRHGPGHNRPPSPPRRPLDDARPGPNRPTHSHGHDNHLARQRQRDVLED